MPVADPMAPPMDPMMPPMGLTPGGDQLMQPPPDMPVAA
jgi:hypothetical protein